MSASGPTGAETAAQLSALVGTYQAMLAQRQALDRLAAVTQADAEVLDRCLQSADQALDAMAEHSQGLGGVPPETGGHQRWEQLAVLLRVAAQ